MINELPLDIIYIISLKFDDIFQLLNLTQTSSSIYKFFTDDYYLEWGRYMYTSEFWEKAGHRSKYIIKPFISMKRELLRIEQFQRHLIKHKYEKWTNKDFYNYWENLESLYLQ